MKPSKNKKKTAKKIGSVGDVPVSSASVGIDKRKKRKSQDKQASNKKTDSAPQQAVDDPQRPKSQKKKRKGKVRNAKEKRAEEIERNYIRLTQIDEEQENKPVADDSSEDSSSNSEASDDDSIRGGASEESKMEVEKDETEKLKPETNQSAVCGEDGDEDDDVAQEGDIDVSDKERLRRTLFVGNVSNSAKAKDLRKLFQPYGRVESIRIRNVIPVNPKIPKKAAYLGRRMSEFVDCYSAYIVFADTPDVDAILAKAKAECHFKEFFGNHIRVVEAEVKHDRHHRCSAFIGNLPYNCTEEEMISTFLAVAKKLEVNLVNVRLNRDMETGACRGVGFVTLEDNTAVQALVNMSNQVMLRKHRLRIEKAQKEKKKNSKTHSRLMKNHNTLKYKRQRESELLKEVKKRRVEEAKPKKRNPKPI